MSVFSWCLLRLLLLLLILYIFFCSFFSVKINIHNNKYHVHCTCIKSHTHFARERANRDEKLFLFVLHPETRSKFEENCWQTCYDCKWNGGTHACITWIVHNKLASNMYSNVCVLCMQRVGWLAIASSLADWMNEWLTRTDVWSFLLADWGDYEYIIE